MTLLIIYDIPSDRLRGRIAEICLDYGLARIQQSAFLGHFSLSLRKRFITELKTIILGVDTKLQVFQLDSDWQKRQVVLEHHSA